MRRVLFGRRSELKIKKNVLYIFITFIPHDDHRDLQTIVSPPALRGTLSRAHLSLENRLSQPDGFFEGLPTVHAEHHDEEVSCEIGYRVETDRARRSRGEYLSSKRWTVER